MNTLKLKRAALGLVNNLKMSFPVLAGVFGLLFLFNLLIDTKTVVRYLGRETGKTGWLIAVVTGIISAGPIYLWYPLLSDLKEKRDA